MAVEIKLSIDAPTPQEIEEIERWWNDPGTSRFMNVEVPFVTDRYSPTTIGGRFPLLGQDQECDALIRAHRFLQRTFSQRPAEEHLAFLKATGMNEAVFAVKRKGDGRLVGATALIVSLSHRTAEVRTMVAPEARGQGVGKEAKRLTLAFGFAIGIEVIYSYFVDSNEATRRINKALGFDREMRIYDRVLVDGKRHDLVVMAITAEQFQLLAKRPAA